MGRILNKEQPSAGVENQTRSRYAMDLTNVLGSRAKTAARKESGNITTENMSPSVFRPRSVSTQLTVCEEHPPYLTFSRTHGCNRMLALLTKSQGL